MNIVLRKQQTVIKEYDEQLVRRLIDKVTVQEDRFTHMRSPILKLMIN